MRLITSNIRVVAEDLSHVPERMFWETKLLKEYGLKVELGPKVHDAYWIIRTIYNTFKESLMTPELVRACGINKLLIKDDMGPNKPYYPNHGYFTQDLVALNEDIFHHPDEPDDFYDSHGYFLGRPQQTLLHEFGHGFDANHRDISVMPAWCRLSGWSEQPQNGLQQLRIKEKGAPEVIGEWYFDPKSEFTRFYAKRNPWDDFADAFSFYVAKMRDKVPAKKAHFFDLLLKKYL